MLMAIGYMIVLALGLAGAALLVFLRHFVPAFARALAYRLVR